MVTDFAQHHPDENGADPMSEPALLSLDDHPDLPPEVALRVLAGALDPDAPPAPADLIPTDEPTVEPLGDDVTPGEPAAGDEPMSDDLAGLTAGDDLPDWSVPDQDPGPDPDPDDFDGPW